MAVTNEPPADVTAAEEVEMRTMTPAGPAIEVRRLAKTYPGGVEAVKGIDFEVGAGEVFGLLGPNGAGKSTTIGMLTTTIAPDRRQRARSPASTSPTEPLAARRASSVVFQDPVVDRALTGRRNLDVHARLWGVDPAAAATRASPSSPTRSASPSCSTGRSAPTAAASAAGSRSPGRSSPSPQVLFLDEPTVGLDPRIRYELLDVIAGLRARGGMTILLTTHYLDEAERLCDRVAIMHAGRIVALDTPAALLAGLGREIVELRVDGDAGAALASLRAHGIAGDDAFAVGSTLTRPAARPAGRRRRSRAIAELGIADARSARRRPTLDDVYLRLTGDRSPPGQPPDLDIDERRHP